MNTDLKGRIVRLADTSYLILHEEDESPEWLRIKALGPRPTVYRMRRTELIEQLGSPATPAESARRVEQYPEHGLTAMRATHTDEV